MQEIKAIETEYNGHRFRSRLEARWAVFLDALGVEYEHEPEGFELPSGRRYLPDFRVKCWGKRGELTDEPFDLYIEVKGKMTDEDREKIREFAGSPFDEDGMYDEKLEKSMRPTLVVGPITAGTCDEWMDGGDYYSYETIDGDDFGAFPCAIDGKLFLMGADSNYIVEIAVAEHAIDVARKARFEFGETPVIAHAG